MRFGCLSWVPLFTAPLPPRRPRCGPRLSARPGVLAAMATAPRHDVLPFVLAQWCSVRKAWVELPGQYRSPQSAEQAAVERGIYRVVYVYDGRRIGMEPFARVGDD